LGFSLPVDYRALVETYGEDSFDDFLWLLHPTSPNPNLNLISELRTQRDALANDPDGVGPRPEDLVPWADTDNGDVCYWRFDSHRRLGNSVIVNEARGGCLARVRPFGHRVALGSPHTPDSCGDLTQSSFRTS